MRFLLIFLCLSAVAVVVGCGQGYEGRKAPPPGSGDPTSIIQEMESGQPGSAAAPKEKPAGAAEAVEEAAAPKALEAKEKPAGDALP
jgi:hypothetical protein